MSRESIKFSIITPTYNRLELIKQSIDSVLAQTYSNWEMIIVDDSTDNKLYNSDWIKNLDERIIYLKNKQNMGANYSRNRALDNISGEFVILLDDDDKLDPNCLKHAYETILKNNNYSWYLSNKIYEDGKCVTYVEKYGRAYAYVLDYLLGSKIAGDHTACIRANSIKNIRFPHDVKNGGEWEFFAKLGNKYKIFTYDFPSTTVRYLEDGLSKNLNTSIFLLKTKLRMLKLLPKIEPKTPMLFLYITTILSVPPIIYLYDLTKKILHKTKLLLPLKKLLTSR